MSEPLIRIEGIAKRFAGRGGSATTVFEMSIWESRPANSCA